MKIDFFFLLNSLIKFKKFNNYTINSGYSRMLPQSSGVGRKREDDENNNKFDARGSGGGGGGGDSAKSPRLVVDSNGSGGYTKTASNDYLNELLNLYKKQPGGGGSGDDFGLKLKGIIIIFQTFFFLNKFLCLFPKAL